MLTLILETSSEKSLLTLAQGGVPLQSVPLIGGPPLSKTLALEVKNLLNGRTPELIAVGIGPGSYTGTRVGAALAKSLAYAWNIPLIGFRSLKDPDPKQLAALCLTQFLAEGSPPFELLYLEGKFKNL